MKVQEIIDALEAADFEQKPLDSGYNYTKKVGHISLTCYIEPKITVEFTSIYHWRNNDVKGAYHIPIKILVGNKEDIKTLFRKTKEYMPQYIGESVDTYEQLEKVIEKVFK